MTDQEILDQLSNYAVIEEPGHYEVTIGRVTLYVPEDDELDSLGREQHPFFIVDLNAWDAIGEREVQQFLDNDDLAGALSVKRLSTRVYPERFEPKVGDEVVIQAGPVQIGGRDRLMPIDWVIQKVQKRTPRRGR